MNNKEALLSKRWILKRDDRDRYYKIKDQIKELRSLFQEISHLERHIMKKGIQHNSHIQERHFQQGQQNQ